MQFSHNFSCYTSHKPSSYAGWLLRNRLASASGEFAHLADIILYHHEWWNGQGYPQGLKGEEIPLLSRIISILDAFEAMTRRQSYKPAKTINEALHGSQRRNPV
jgi:HD-GYP domain-containing protein (c-di-GMP phosphodiesterase class II)